MAALTRELSRCHALFGGMSQLVRALVLEA